MLRIFNAKSKNMKTPIHHYLFGIFLTLSTLSFGQDMADVTIQTIPVNGPVYILEGRGGNIGVSVGADGVFVIDDQFAPLSEKILAAIKMLSDGPLQYVANTHYHGDHSGGNVNMQKAGATIVAHKNVRKRLEQPDRNGNDRPQEALPVITYKTQMSIYINGEEVVILHVGNAHTDGDSLLYFTQSNVLHTGDTFFNGRYPYIDLNSGGSVEGYLAAVKRGMMLVDEDTKIIPGHGPLASRADYMAFMKMLEGLKENALRAINAGMSFEEFVADESITAEYDAQGFGSGFINPKRMRETLYKCLKKQP